MHEENNQISIDVFEFDSRLNSWNNLIKKVKKQRNNNKNIVEIYNWWKEYFCNEKEVCIHKYNIPDNVWDIINKPKINKTEKIYGIYYTIKSIYSTYRKLSISLIKIQSSNDVELSIIFDDFLITLSGIYDLKNLEFIEIKKWEIN